MFSQAWSGLEILVERVLTGMRHSAGGVKLISGTERITLDNTLDERLRLLEDRVCSSVPWRDQCHRYSLLMIVRRCCLRSGRTSSVLTPTASSTHELAEQYTQAQLVRTTDRALGLLVHILLLVSNSIACMNVLNLTCVGSH